MVANEIRSLERRFGHIVTRQDEEVAFEEFRVKNLPKTAQLSARIFSGRFAPVFRLETSSEPRIAKELMRYSAYCPSYVKDPAKLSTFNARRDNLRSPFWQGAFGFGHGLLFLDGFFEWVAVKDLLAGGVVSLDQVKKFFENQSEMRKKQFELAGKKWTPTPTERVDPRFRKIVIEFRNPAREPLAAAVIFNRTPSPDHWNGGFAIVTDEPLPEVLAAGHDRTPAFLKEDVWEEWLHPKGKTPRQLLALLDEKPILNLEHLLEA
jgi:putative SOS response-associated peptidase YedK